MKKINRDRHYLSEKMGQTPITQLFKIVGNWCLSLFFPSNDKKNSVCPYFFPGTVAKWCLSLFILAALFCFILPAVAEQSNIIIKLVAANPSKGQVQKVTLKAYLPKEAKPEDVVDMADLAITYDTQQGSYYVSGEYEIKPGEFLEKDIEIRDIWAIPQKDIDLLRQEVAQMKNLLKNTDYAERMDFLKISIDNKLDQIVQSQLNAPTNPERHISNYRDSMKTMDLARQDVAVARSLLAQGRGLPTTTVWKLVLSIIIFLALLGISFYVIWQKQLKSIISDTLINK